VLVKPRFSKAERESIVLPDNLKSILVGLILGDLNVQKSKLSKNARLCLCQGIVHDTYLLHLYNLFELYCSTGPKLITPMPDKELGKVYPVLRFQTRALLCFTELYRLFYPAGKKEVPLNIADLLTPLSLAY
jgi:hypothetical protein